MFIIMAMVIESGDKFPAEYCDNPTAPTHTKIYTSGLAAALAVTAYREKYPKCTFFLKNISE